MTDESRTKITLILLFTYILAAIGYLLYSIGTGTGLAGLIIYYQFHFFGSSTDMVTIFAGLIVLTIPAFVVLPLAMKLVPKVDSPPQQAAPRLPVKRSAARPWIILATVSCIVGVIPCVIYLVLARIDRADQQRPIYGLNLAKPATPPADAKFVTLAGYETLKLQYRFEETSNGHKTSYTLVPLVEANWSPGKPVIYFLKSDVTRLRDPLEGRLERDALPVYARKAFEQRGLKIPSTHYIVHPARFRDGKVASSMDDYEPLPWFGLGLGLVSMIIGSIIIVQHRKVARAERAASSSA